MHNMQSMTVFKICKKICTKIWWLICRICTVCHWFNMQNMLKICRIICKICKIICRICNSMSPNPICRICQIICQIICSICQTICLICSLEQIDCLICPICKICKIICTICAICNHAFNMSNMHSPLCWCIFGGAWSSFDRPVREEFLKMALANSCYLNSLLSQAVT